jgi:Flp pilus assembly protein TadB
VTTPREPAAAASNAASNAANNTAKKWQNVSSIHPEEISMTKATVSASTSAAPKGVYDDVDHSEAPGHGNSPAAWTCVIVMLVGALIAAIAFVIASTPIFVAGAAIMVLGLLAGWVMRKAGYGVGGSKLKNTGH